MMARLRWTARRTLRAKTFGSIGPEPLEVRRHALRIHVDPSGADSIAFHDAPMVFLYFYNELYAVQPWIRHFVPPVIFNGQRWIDVSIDTTKR